MKVSPACDYCYAESMMDHRYGRVKWGIPGSGVGTRSLTSEANRRKPLSWNIKAEKDGTRPFVFCSSLSDVFDNQVPSEWREELFDLIHETPNLVWLLLTKRPQNIFKLSEAAGGLPTNVALGTTIEDQERADKNVPALVLCGYEPLFFFVSCEPLLGPVDLTNICPPDAGVSGANFFWRTSLRPHIGWVITGGETDQGRYKARPSNPEWYRSLRDQCAANSIPYHHKQNGEWVSYDQIGASGWDYTSTRNDKRYGVLTYGDWDERFDMFGSREFETQYPWTDSDANPCMVKVGKRIAGRKLDGREHNDRPKV
jgi:protein gp37